MENNGKYWKCGYCGFVISCNLTVTIHKCFKEYDENLHDIICNENNVLTIVMKEHRNNHDPCVEVDEPQNKLNFTDRDEKLISAVAERPALYDLSLPLTDRTKIKKQALWDEVFNIMGGTLPRDEIPKRWKYLRDRYVKAKREVNKYQPSGSSGGETNKITPSFKHYYLMNFLDGMKETNENTITNVSSPGISEETPDVETLVTPKKRNKLVSNNGKISNNTLEEAFIASLNGPAPDEIDGFLIRVGASLKRLPLRIRSEVEIKFLSILKDAEDEFM